MTSFRKSSDLARIRANVERMVEVPKRSPRLAPAGTMSSRFKDTSHLKAKTIAFLSQIATIGCKVRRITVVAAYPMTLIRKVAQQMIRRRSANQKRLIETSKWW